MKHSIFSKYIISLLVGVIVVAGVAFAATGTIDPASAGNYKAAFLDTSVVTDTAINFGKFTTQSQYNITVTDSALRGFAWGSSVGYMVMNCADTTSGCSSNNGNFKVANDGTGLLSGYAWGENTGWINFGPFTNQTISTVKIGTNGNFGGTLGSAGYAWSQNYGWIVFDCTNANTCVNTDWRAPTGGNTGGGGGGGAGGTPGGSTGGNTNPGTTPTTPGAPASGIPATLPTVPPNYIGLVASSVICDSDAAMPHWGLGGHSNIGPTTAIDFVNASNGHCHFDAGQSFTWAYPDGSHVTAFGPTDDTGTTTTITPITTGNAIPVRQIVRPGFAPFSLDTYGDNNHFPSAEDSCETDALNYDNLDFIRTQQSQRTYYCISFNTPAGQAMRITQPTVGEIAEPRLPPPSTTPHQPTTPATPATPSNTDNSSTTTSNPEQPPIGDIPTSEPTTTPIRPDAQPSDSPVNSSADTPGLFSNGLSLPPTLVESINSIVGSIGTLVNNIITAPVITNVLTAARTESGKTVTSIVSAIGVTTTLAASVGILLLANPFSFAELFLLPFRLWTLLLVALGLKKKGRPWGTVYDSVTKQPIDPAYVMLTDMEGNEVATSITDIDGRYGFTVAPGTYKIVANKTNYVYPSQKLAGAEADVLYGNLYFGQTIVVEHEGDLIAKNIPLDQQNFDWNEFAKNEQKRLSYFKRSDVLIARISNFFYWLGFAVSAVALLASHSVYNTVVFCVYVVMFAVRHYSPQFKAKGSITDTLTDQPLSFAIVHIMSAGTGQEITHKVADRLGNYYCLVPNGTYNIVVDRKNPDATYTKIPIAEPVTVTEGYLKANFKI